MSVPSPDKMHETFGGAFAAKDIDALLDLYDESAIQLQQDGEVLHGRDALRPVFERLLNTPMDAAGTQRKPMVNGDVALTSTRYDFEVDGIPTHMVTAEVSRRQPDGTWRVLIDAPYLFVG
ncbi:MAG: nuclear transport factor 2 family protein [Solirubrobacterales bacterium]|nr:nuclear transport factor 2 family protein [Solirubrobacterales bacterium]